ncbi:MAG: DNA-binding protein WhiA [Eubacteriales bacterium]
MTFTERVRAELVQSLCHSQCCRRAALCGILINADCSPDGGIYAKLSDKGTTELMLKLLRENYGREACAEYSNSYGRTTAEVGFTSEKLADKLREFSFGSEITLFKCKDCKSAFFAGLLLSAANFSNPERESRMEIRINDPVRAESVRRLFADIGHEPRVSDRDGISSLIFKRSEDVEDILTISGAGTSSMELMQGKLMREFRGKINRDSNCEFGNIGKTAAAANAQIEAIRYLRNSGRFDQLPDELKETATLREEEPDMSLSDLAAKHCPPITKSGLNHRLKKLMELAEK